jgi:hypothetical protein
MSHLNFFTQARGRSRSQEKCSELNDVIGWNPCSKFVGRHNQFTTAKEGEDVCRINKLLSYVCHLQQLQESRHTETSLAKLLRFCCQEFLPSSVFLGSKGKLEWF